MPPSPFFMGEAAFLNDLAQKSFSLTVLLILAVATGLSRMKTSHSEHA